MKIAFSVRDSRDLPRITAGLGTQLVEGVIPPEAMTKALLIAIWLKHSLGVPEKPAQVFQIHFQNWNSCFTFKLWQTPKIEVAKF